MMIHTPYRCAHFAIVISAIMLSPDAMSDELTFLITVDGSQETPAVDTTANGIGTATLDTDTNQFSWDISFLGLSSPQTDAHFHGAAPRCESAPPVVTLPIGSPIVGSMTLTAQQAADVQQGLWYLNIHSQDHTSGEIRGRAL